MANSIAVGVRVAARVVACLVGTWITVSGCVSVSMIVIIVSLPVVIILSVRVVVDVVGSFSIFYCVRLFSCAGGAYGWGDVRGLVIVAHRCSVVRPNRRYFEGHLTFGVVMSMCSNKRSVVCLKFGRIEHVPVIFRER